MTELDLQLPDPARIVRVVDVESSGLPEEDPASGIVELGWCDLRLDTMEISDPYALYVNPGHHIPPQVRAVHHISDDLVRRMGVTPAFAIADMLFDLGPHDVLAAHRVSFEQAFLPDVGGRRWLCSYKTAMRAWKDTPGLSNQTLRYYLDIDLEPDFVDELAMPPHRAGPDAYTTAFIIRRLLSLRPLTRLLEISLEPPLSVNINFGKHKGQKWIDLPWDYLDWMVNKPNELDEETRAMARYWLGRR